MWGDHQIPIQCKVWGDHKNHKRHEDTSHVGDHLLPVPYKLRGDHKIPGIGNHKSHIRHEDTSHVGGPYVYVEGTIQYLFHIR